MESITGQIRKRTLPIILGVAILILIGLITYLFLQHGVYGLSGKPFASTVTKIPDGWGLKGDSRPYWKINVDGLPISLQKDGLHVRCQLSIEEVLIGDAWGSVFASAQQCVLL